MAKRPRPLLRLVPSSGRRLKDLARDVDLLFTLVGPFMAAAFAKHPEFKDWILNDLSEMKARNSGAEYKTAFDDAINVVSQMAVMKH
jgi:hypothetical protein